MTKEQIIAAIDRLFGDRGQTPGQALLQLEEIRDRLDENIGALRQMIRGQEDGQ